MSTCGIVVTLNGEIVSTGAGAAALGSPVNCITWLANTLGGFGIELKAGELILSGSLVPLQAVKPGDAMHMEIGGQLTFGLFYRKVTTNSSPVSCLEATLKRSKQFTVVITCMVLML